jgi:predicted nucleotidyltransferase component of viral defense system
LSIAILQDRLKSYSSKTAESEEQALREITQEVILAALGRTDFFSKAAFHGGTSLRILYGLNRFSEDLDFALHKPMSNFDLQPFLLKVKDELEAYGFKLEIVERSRADTIVKKAFLKDDSIGRVLKLEHLQVNRSMKKIRIKLEVDTNPPEGAIIEPKYLNFPFLSSLAAHELPSLFAGKLHALLCRDHVKGRDWYDFLWYVARRCPVNLPLLQAALYQAGPWKKTSQQIDMDWVRRSLHEKIERLDWEHAVLDVRRFLKPEELPSLNLWSSAAFLSQLELFSSSDSQ